MCSRWMAYTGPPAATFLVLAFLLVPQLVLSQTKDAKPEATATKAAPDYSEWPFDAKEAVRRQEETTKVLGVPKEAELALSDKVKMKFVLIPAGKFMMGGERLRGGKEGPKHEVTIGKSFYMGIYEVTQEQYEAVVGNNPAWLKGPTIPVDTTTPKDEEGFCKKASQKTGRTVRLPTSAEWEYACRAGTATRFYFGDDEKKVGDYAWYMGIENDDHQTHPVGQKKPNAWGLYDMYGNVWERVSDSASNTGYTWRSSGPGDPPSILGSALTCGEKGALMWCGFRAAMDVK